MGKKRIIGVNEGGRRIGEDHHRAVLTDDEVELMRQFRELQKPDGSPQYTYRSLSVIFEVSIGTVYGICSMRWRNQFIVNFKTVHIKPKDE